MYTARHGFIALDGSVVRPTPSADVGTYGDALSHYQRSVRLSARLQERRPEAEATAGGARQSAGPAPIGNPKE